MMYFELIQEKGGQVMVAGGPIQVYVVCVSPANCGVEGMLVVVIVKETIA